MSENKKVSVILAVVVASLVALVVGSMMDRSGDWLVTDTMAINLSNVTTISSEMSGVFKLCDTDDNGMPQMIGFDEQPINEANIDKLVKRIRKAGNIDRMSVKACVIIDGRRYSMPSMTDCGIQFESNESLVAYMKAILANAQRFTRR